MADGEKLGDLIDRLRKKPAYHSWSVCWPLNKEAADAIEGLVIETDDAWLYREEDIQRLSAENADAQAKEAFALGKLEETLKIESELRAENSRLESLVHRLQATSMEQAKSGEKLQDKLDEADAAFEESDTACADLEDENKRLEALDKDRLRASEQWVAENARLEKNLAAARLSNDHLRDRYVPCPDHRDKHKTGDECLMCQLERVSTVPAPDGINDRGSDEYANPERDGDKQEQKDG